MRPAHLSPSQFHRMMTSGRKKDEIFGKTAETYAEEIVQRMLGVHDDYVSPAMEWGIKHEPEAIERYQIETFSTVEAKSRIAHPDFEYVSGEPDGIVGDGIIEVKCPNSANHFKNLLNGEQIAQYQWQIQGYMWLAEKEWCDFVSYDPRYPEKYQISINRVVRDDDVIAQLEERCPLFWETLVLPLIEKLEQL